MLECILEASRKETKTQSLLAIWLDGLALMSIYECIMVDTESEPTPDVRCTNVEKHTMDVEQINSRLDGKRKPNSEVKVDKDTIDDYGSDQSVK